MKKLERFVTEYKELAKVLSPGDFRALLGATLINTGPVMKSGKLTAVDAAMSRNLTVHFNQVPVVLPLSDIDCLLQERKDNPTFGNLREIYARNCYLFGLRLDVPQRAVLDLGANRGMFSILALVALQAELVVGVEPRSWYDAIFDLLLKANHCDPGRAPRYDRLVASPSTEQKDPSRFVSISTILRQRNIERFNLVKIDIEGGEKDLFSEPEWLAHVDTITMELHPSFVGDLSLIPDALRKYGFKFALLSQAREPAAIDSAEFLIASCTGALAS